MHTIHRTSSFLSSCRGTTLWVHVIFESWWCLPYPLYSPSTAKALAGYGFSLLEDFVYYCLSQSNHCQPRMTRSGLPVSWYSHFQWPLPSYLCLSHPVTVSWNRVSFPETLLGNVKSDILTLTPSLPTYLFAHLEFIFDSKRTITPGFPVFTSLADPGYYLWPHGGIIL